MAGRVGAIPIDCAHGWWLRSTARTGGGAIDAVQTEKQAAIRFGVSVRSVSGRRRPTAGIAPMHAQLPVSLAAADVTVAAHAAALAAALDAVTPLTPAGWPTPAAYAPRPI